MWGLREDTANPGAVDLIEDLITRTIMQPMPRSLFVVKIDSWFGVRWYAHGSLAQDS